MLDLQVPLLAAKALLLLLLFAFVYTVVRRGIGDLRSIPEDKTFIPGKGEIEDLRDELGTAHTDGTEGRDGLSALIVENSEVLAPSTRFTIRGDMTSIGRSPASDIVLKNDDYASGRHARLTRHGGLLYVEDAESTNGTYVNGRKTIGATPLRGGDRVQVGSTTFRYSE